MTHELRLNKSVYSKKQIKDLVNDHIDLHGLHDLPIKDASNDDEYIAQWHKEAVLHVCYSNVSEG